jgi:hypothetical protein
MLIFSRQGACQDATAQMALLQFMHAGKAQVASYNGTIT